MDEEAALQKLVDIALELGAFRAGAIPTERIETDSVFRELCAKNICGNYGRCWTCPPDVGDIETLMARVKTYRWALVYQTVGMLEDSYDFEGMTEAGERHNRMMIALRERFEEEDLPRKLHLGAGGCRLCEVCAKKTNEPCRHPDQAVASLEAYGINVSVLAKTAGMKYINGQNTVTYFGAVLFDLT